MLIGQNVAFEREIFEAGNKLSILKRSAVREKIGTALKQFLEEGWLSEKDYENFIQSLLDDKMGYLTFSSLNFLMA